MIQILVVLLIALIAFSVWNLFTLKDIKKHNRSNQVISDERYFELKYKLEYITTITVVVVGVGAFFGYQWFDGIKKDAEKNLVEKTTLFESKYDSIKCKLKQTDDSLRKYQKMMAGNEYYFKKFQVSQKNISDSINRSAKELFSISKRIKIINEKNIIKSDFYIVDNLQINLKYDADYRYKFYYKDLVTITGDKLPVFNKTPFLSINPENGIQVFITELNKDYFALMLISIDGNIDVGRFSIMLSQKKTPTN